MGRRRRGGAERLAFGEVAALIEEAKDRLLVAVPRPRREPESLPLALLAFDRKLGEARAAMESWRTPATEDSWRRCLAGLDEARRRAESLRLEAPSLDFEALVLVLGDVIAPLEAFGEAERSLR